jgi:hypothetical protein
MSKISHNVDVVVGLQNCMDILKSELTPSTGKCQISIDDRNQVVDKNIEEVPDVKVEQDPGPAMSMGINSEPSVSCMSVCIEVYAHWSSNVQTVCRIRCEWKI